jgi:LPPG:FO 2-phospho-L-lactate transferase
MMRSLGLEASAYGVAQIYKNFLYGFVIDKLDEDQKQRVESLGLKVVATNSLMKDLDHKERLAKACLDIALH